MLDDGDALPCAAQAEACAPEMTGAATGAGKGAGAIGAALFLAACGGGGDGGGGATGDVGGGIAGPTPVPTPAATPTPTTPIVVVEAKPTAAEASRFLHQATMGATRAGIEAVMAKGYAAWLDEQFATARETSHWDWLVAGGFNVSGNMFNESGFDATMWRQLIVDPAQLRQRVGMALLEILVVGISGIGGAYRQFAMAAYVDLLLDKAFGNYRDILDAVTFSPAMGSFLTFMGNRKANPSTGAMPDENYARELLQLFTIGLQQLNMDGSVKTANGAVLETYTSADVSGLARVFTGLNWASTDNSTPDRLRLPLVMNASFHESGPSTFLGTTVSGDGVAAIRTALDAIFAHPNVAPFIAKQLIQKLVTSNPTPAYIARVAAVFANNGSGVRGDLKAVVRAILLDAEARSAAALTSTSAGKLREPIMRLTAWARAFKVASPSGAWAFGDTSAVTNRLGQSPGRSGSVFNFFRPGYTPPATRLSDAGLLAPEFQLANEQSVVGYINYMQVTVGNGAGDAKADYADMLAKAGDSDALVEEANLLLAAGQLSPATVQTIRTAVDSVSMTLGTGPINRVGIAVLLTLAAPEFLTLK
ncbi:DUF1800 domain-containing protein [Sphingomonas sp. Leaf412]|uniref:DUF1800 domain-containing protein n=1 Tax=Sphingomonas sp. Leaf412 TaxID=1736370 RepID=UPI000AD571E0|nr:DUF1800 domain-containing protein [Sphingomonas sp. Leaf412]